MNVDIRKALPHDVVTACDQAGVLGKGTSVVPWLLSRDGLARAPVYRYVSFLKTMHELSHALAEIYDLRSPDGSRGRKEHLRHVGPREMVFIANHLYVLDSCGVAGGVLECGTSHAYSTCVLSHACQWLGRTLYAADSYEGLPAPDTDEPFFREGDYAASLEEVQQSIQNLGRPDCVEYVKGYFSDSLQGFEHELCLLWIDVDLFDSAVDVLNGVFTNLDQRGAIFCHEFTDQYNQLHARDVRRPPNAVYDRMERDGLHPISHHLVQYFGAIGFETSEQLDAVLLLPELLDALDRADHRARQYEELKNCNTVRTAFRLKNWLRLGR